MKLISWNVNGIRACVNKGFTKFFEEINADIFCIQETKCQPGQIDLEFEGYKSYWNSAERKGYSGTAIFTKKEPISVNYGIGIEEHDNEGRVITLEFEDFYMNHLISDVVKKFELPSIHIAHMIREYYNIPKHTPHENTIIQFANMSEEDRIKRGQKIGKSSQGRVISEETRKKISESQKGVPKPLENNKGWFKKGQKPWNYKKKGVQKWSEDQRSKYLTSIRKYWDTKDSKSNIEKEIEQELLKKFNKEDIFYQYSDERYPYRCDFYIKSIDTFIEVNYWWHHGPHPFNEDNEEDIELLNTLKEEYKKDNTKTQYLEAIRIWTEIDPLKINIAKQNNLNYIMLYPNERFDLYSQAI